MSFRYFLLISFSVSIVVEKQSGPVHKPRQVQGDGVQYMKHEFKLKAQSMIHNWLGYQKTEWIKQYENRQVLSSLNIHKPACSKLHLNRQ